MIVSTLASLMADLTQLGIRLEAQGDRLRDSPRSAVTPDLAQRMKAHKSELLTILRRDPKVPTIDLTNANVRATDGQLADDPEGSEVAESIEVIDAAPDAEWRLIIALSRYGGLRCPSEHLGLTLDDVDWEHGREHIRSPKTARHTGHESRMIPLFPQLRPYLEAVFDAVKPGTKYFITRYRGPTTNLRTRMTRIVKQAGLQPWPRIFHNLRASRQTELEETFPTHVVCKWIGSSPQIARKHYLRTTDEHFDRAIQGGAKSGAEVAQNQAQHPHARDRTHSQGADDKGRKPLTSNEVTRRDASRRDRPPEKMAEVHGNRTHRSHG